MKRLALLLPIWLLLAAGENAPVHACAMHSAHGAQAADPHAAHHAHQAGSKTPAKTPGCSCIGACCTPVPPTTPVAATVPAAVVLEVLAVQPLAPSFVVARETPRLLPYSNGPPVSL